MEVQMASAPLIEQSDDVQLSKLKASKEWQALTAKQRLWVDTLVASNGDAVLATRSAYAAAPENATLLTYEVQANLKIRAALAIYYAQSPLDVFLADLKTTISKSKGVAKTEAMKLYADLQLRLLRGEDLSGWGGLTPSKSQAAAEPENPEPVYHVGDIVLIDNKKCRVTAINADGRPTEADPL
jgi:hypothetical protein